MAAYWEVAAHSAYDMLSKYKYLIVNLVFWSGNFFPDHCLLVPLDIQYYTINDFCGI